MARPASQGGATPATLAYDGTTLAETPVDLTTSARFATSYAVNLPDLVGSATAYVGFAGGTDAFNATQQISGVSFTTAVPEPTTVALLGVAGEAGVRSPVDRRSSDRRTAWVSQRLGSASSPHWW